MFSPSASWADNSERVLTAPQKSQWTGVHLPSGPESPLGLAFPLSLFHSSQPSSFSLRSLPKISILKLLLGICATWKTSYAVILWSAFATYHLNPEPFVQTHRSRYAPSYELLEGPSALELRGRYSSSWAQLPLDQSIVEHPSGEETSTEESFYLISLTLRLRRQKDEMSLKVTFHFFF